MNEHSEQILKKSFAILGAGRSGIGIARLLNKKGYHVILSDNSPLEKLSYLDIDVLKNERIDFEFNGHSEKIFDYDIIIKSPGILPENEIIQKALKLGKKIYSEIEVAYWFCPCPVIAITGTNGKTTTTELTGAIFKSAGFNTKVCGNVGLAFSEVIDELNEQSIVVLEVSSFQLEDTEKFKPRVASFLNFTPDHLEWHKNLENYMKAKLKVNVNQNDEDTIIINHDDESVRNQRAKLNGKIAAFSIKENLYKTDYQIGAYLENDDIIYFDKNAGINEKIINKNEIYIRGNHNVYNSLAALISAKAFGISSEKIKNTFKDFKGVEHRIEFVRELNGVKYYNDSKATNLDSMIVAVESFEKNIILILGGKKMENDFSKVKELVKKRVKLIVTIGDSRFEVAKYFSGCKKVLISDDFEKAIKIAYLNSGNGDVVLFSPAYKSFDMFDNFEHRGKEFKKIVNKL